MITNLFSHMEIHERIRSIRLTKNFTQEYMAQQLDIDVANYGRLERGKAKIDIERLKKIAIVLNISIEELITSNTLNEKAISILKEMLSEIKSINNKINQQT